MNDIKTIYEAILKRKSGNCEETELPIDIGYGIAVTPSIPVEDPRYDIIPWEEVNQNDINKIIEIVYSGEPESKGKLILVKTSNDIKVDLDYDLELKTDHLPVGFYYFYKPSIV